MTSAEDVKHSILNVGVWQLGDYIFSSGKRANNKFDMPRILDFHSASAKFLSRLGELILKEKPDAIWGVPTGGQLFAEVLHRRLKLPLVRLSAVMDEGQKVFVYASGNDKRRAQGASSLVGIEDVATEFTQVAGALKIPELSEKTLAVIVGWRRGIREMEQPVSMPVYSVVEEPVPNIITPDHPFYIRYSHLAIREPTHA